MHYCTLLLSSVLAIKTSVFNILKKERTSLSLAAAGMHQAAPLRMAATAVLRRLLHSPSPKRSLRITNTRVNATLQRSLSSSSDQPTKKYVNTKVNFSLSDDDDDDNDDNVSVNKIDKSKLPPPYDPFKKVVDEEPTDPRNLQEIFHKIRTEGLTNNAVKMFDALSKDGLTHEALQLFAQIKDKGHMPDVVAHTAVIEAYASAGQGKEALRVFIRMLASGVAPNAYTYAVLIKGLAAAVAAADGNAKLLGDAQKYLMEMVGKGMRPNAGTYTAVFEAFVRAQKVDEARELLQQMKAKGFVPDEKAVREALIDKRGQGFRGVVNILFGK